MGVDGPYINQQHLMIDADEFRAADLSQPISLGRRFDLVQSLEVAEHLPGSGARDFIGTLTAHGPLVMFSAAVPGQGGEHHINEQPLEYWREKFREHGYSAIDCVRPEAVQNARIQPWYRYNTVLYAEIGHLEKTSDRVRSFRVAEYQRLHDFWPLSERIRHAVVRQLPSGAVDYLSRRKALLEVRKAKSVGSWS